MQNLSCEEFLNEKVKVIFEPMISKLLLEKPEEPVNNIKNYKILNFQIPYMIDFLGKFSGKNNNENMEREELKNLRKEVAKLKKKVKFTIKI